MAICLAVPAPSLPTLPSPLSLAPPAPPSLPEIPGLCCKLPPLPFSIPPIPIPALIANPAVIAALNAYILAAQAFLTAMPIKCPVE